MKILYIENSTNPCNYYSDIRNYLSKYSNIKVIHTNSQFEINNFKPDIIILGFTITDCSDRRPTFSLNNQSIPLYIILNKEYTGLNKKLEWIKSLNPKKVFTVHHDFKKYEHICSIPFCRIMWSADHNLFKKYDDIYKQDLFFSGVIRPEQTDNMRLKIYNKLNLLNTYNLLIKVGFFDSKTSRMTGNNNPFNNNEYAKTINHSKIVLTTTGPADLVGTRYFEIMASNKALIICNKMPKDVYDDIVVDGFNCVMFDDENDFIEKCKYYLEHEDERIKIVNKAYEYFLEKHTWDHKVKYLLENL